MVYSGDTVTGLDCVIGRVGITVTHPCPYCEEDVPDCDLCGDPMEEGRTVAHLHEPFTRDGVNVVHICDYCRADLEEDERGGVD